MSISGCQLCTKSERDWDYRHCGCACHVLPGEHERMAFHLHQFEHECYWRECPESERLYSSWQAALARARNEAAS